MLDAVLESQADAVFALLDFHPFIEDHTVARKLKDVAQALKTSNKTIVLVSPVQVLPAQLSKEVVVQDFDLPTLNELEQGLEGFLEQAARKGGVRVKPLTKAAREKLARAAQGLTLAEFEGVMAKSIVVRKTICEDTLEDILEEKKQIIRKSGTLEYFPAEENLDQVGGLGSLKHWLSKRADAFSEEARAFGLPAPKGLLLVGVQGCGKSLTAKAVAAHWNLPLLRLDVGRVFAGIVGSSEHNIRHAIKTAESVAPCVLWIDEIEKGFSGSASSHFSDAGTAARVFGSFTTWLQEKKDPVFVIATANDVSLLPAEVLRKGRFDEVFFVDLPGVEEREEIARIHLLKRHRDPQRFDCPGIARAAEGFTGAEIEQAIVSGMYDAFARRQPLTTADVVRNLSDTVPLSKMMAEHIERLREWARTRARKASANAGVFE
jgi:SpoVK/Ycf46/Vps4 family AAA+-type ATPase